MVLTVVTSQSSCCGVPSRRCRTWSAEGGTQIDARHELALELQIELRLQRIVISTQQQADQAHSPGSPTVRIAGTDPVDSDAPASPARRLYCTEAGLRPIPARATLHAALQTAAEARGAN
jgi:hypothetical protein